MPVDRQYFTGSPAFYVWTAAGAWVSTHRFDPAFNEVRLSDGPFWPPEPQADPFRAENGTIYRNDQGFRLRATVTFVIVPDGYRPSVNEDNRFTEVDLRALLRANHLGYIVTFHPHAPSAAPSSPPTANRCLLEFAVSRPRAQDETNVTITATGDRLTAAPPEEL